MICRRICAPRINPSPPPTATSARSKTEQKRITTELAALDAQHAELSALRDEQAQLIANHLAAAYRLSGEDFLKLLLNQQSPELVERMLRYHGYFSAARTEALTEYQETLTAIEANAAAKQAREQALAKQQSDLDGDRAELRAKREARERRARRIAGRHAGQIAGTQPLDAGPRTASSR